MYKEDGPDIDLIDLKVLKESDGLRLDSFLVNELSKEETISRSYLQKIIKEGGVTLGDLVLKASYKVKEGDLISIEFVEPDQMQAIPQKMDLDIVYEDSQIIIANKGRGMVVHPGPGNHDSTLVNGLLYHCNSLSDIGGDIRPGIVHRLDKDTTGLMVVAKNNRAHAFLAQDLKDRKIVRKYLALVEGQIKEKRGTIIAPIGRHRSDRQKMAVDIVKGKEAKTFYEVIESLSGFSLIECTLDTGRTHQIRVHLAYIGYPVVCDNLYGLKNNRGLAGQLLHAYKLGLRHPTSKEYMEFTKEIPEDFKNFLEGKRI